MGLHRSAGRALQRERAQKPRVRIPSKPRKTFFRATSQMLRFRIVITHSSMDNRLFFVVRRSCTDHIYGHDFVHDETFDAFASALSAFLSRRHWPIRWFDRSTGRERPRLLKSCTRLVRFVKRCKITIFALQNIEKTQQIFAKIICLLGADLSQLHRN